MAAAAALLAGCGGGDDVYQPGDRERLQTADIPQAIDELFPETASRGLVLNRCAACHTVACVATERRTSEQWDAVEYAHADYIPGLSIEDRGKIFDYLKRHFGPDSPEPQVPAELLADGCPQMEP